MSSECEFKLSKEDAPYFVGVDDVEGVVTLETKTEKRVKDIFVEFWGGVKNEYDNDTDNEDDEFIRHDLYLESLDMNDICKEDFVYEKVNVHAQGVLTAGTHTWNFKFPLPENCLSSAEGEWGRIRYVLSLKICNEDDEDDTIFKQPISVIKNLDLNDGNDFKSPVDCELATTRIIDHKSCNVSHRLVIPFGAYVPGQAIKFKLDIKNNPANTIEYYEVHLVTGMVFNYNHPDFPSKLSEFILCTKKVLKDEAEEQVVNDEIIVPPLPPTTHAELLTVDYMLRITAHSALTFTDFRVELPIIIGTLPISDDQTLETDEEGLDAATPSSATKLTHYCTFHTFEEFDQDGFEFPEDPEAFSPLYPVYKQKN